MNIPNEIALLLALTQKVNEKGDDLIAEANKLYATHAREVMELRAMWEEIGYRLDHEERRFARYFPQEIKPENREKLTSREAVSERPNGPLPQGAPAREPAHATGGANPSTLAEAMRSAAARMGDALPSVVGRGPKTAEG